MGRVAKRGIGYKQDTNRIQSRIRTGYGAGYKQDTEQNTKQDANRIQTGVGVPVGAVR
jgi:hypothetical protein